MKAAFVNGILSAKIFENTRMELIWKIGIKNGALGKKCLFYFNEIEKNWQDLSFPHNFLTN